MVEVVNTKLSRLIADIYYGHYYPEKWHNIKKNSIMLFVSAKKALLTDWHVYV